jgi:acetyltransferase-like isoleucine patch superfamily enzyme
MDYKKNEMYNRETLLDILPKFTERLLDYITRPYWKIRLGNLGHKSKIKRGVKIIGNGKRISIGNNFTIWHRCFIAIGNGNISIGNNGHLGVDVYLNASMGNIIIGDNVAIAPKTQIYSYSDQYCEGKKIGEFKIVSDVNIMDNVLVGSGVVILPGITVGTGAVIGAGAVVTKDVKPYSIVAGVPAKEIRKR